MKKQKSPASQVKAMQDAHDKAIRRQAEAFRKNYLIPFCDKYKASFLAGNGGWSFFVNDGEGDLLDSRVARAARIPASELRRIVDVLTILLAPFGYGMSCGQSWRAPRESAGSFGYEVPDYDTRKR